MTHIEEVCRESQIKAEEEAAFYENSLLRMEWLVGVLRKSGDSPEYQTKANTAMLREIRSIATNLLRMDRQGEPGWILTDKGEKALEAYLSKGGRYDNPNLALAGHTARRN